jgi:hypothetical protein
VKISYKSRLSVAAVFLSLSAVASAADLVKGTYDVNAYVTSATGTLCATANLKKGTAQVSSVIFPGNGQLKMILASPYTQPTGKAGSAATNVCVAAGKVPTTGLDGASMVFNCFNDTVAGPAKTAQAQLKAKFHLGASHSPSIYQVTVSSQILVNGANICTFTTDGTYTLQ